ncbi:MAG: AAA family ATPase [Pirellulales bacterium]|nr:AAA family ATPase [Pirellulales bacterium]
MTAENQPPLHSVPPSGFQSAPSLVDWLSTPDAYPERPASVRLVETHISCVFLTDRFAYKLKKPVRFDFLDFSTIELRRNACEEEVRLNRRLAAEVYLGLAAVRRDAAGNFYLDECDTGDGDVVDWLVKMHRLPDDATLLAKIRTGTATDADADAIADRLAEFYRASPPAQMPPADYRSGIEQHVRANRAELLRAEHGLNGSAVKRIHAAQLRLLLLWPDLLDARLAGRQIVEGHGDLRPEHIYLFAPAAQREAGQFPRPVMIDCIEFSQDYRRLDLADELSFLATECDFAGAEALGRRIFEQACSLLGDRPPPRLTAFYRSYRACVRAKVAALRARQQLPEAQAASYAEAQRHLQWAERYDRQLPPPFLLVVSGLMGSGKSTLAGRLSESLGAELRSTDAIRQQRYGKSQQPLAYGAGHYRLDDRLQIYNMLLEDARKDLQEGLSVILDGAFPYVRLRAAAVELANREHAAVLIVHCRCPDDVARQRIADRLARGKSHSEARPEIYDQQRDEEEPETTNSTVVEIDTTIESELQIQRVMARLRQVQVDAT